MSEQTCEARLHVPACCRCSAVLTASVGLRQQRALLCISKCRGAPAVAAAACSTCKTLQQQLAVGRSLLSFGVAPGTPVVCILGCLDLLGSLLRSCRKTRSVPAAGVGRHCP